MSAHQFRIGAVTVTPNLVLAPMSGITDSVYRSLVKEQNPGAVGLVVPALVSIEALTRQNVRTHNMMRFRPLERPISIQLFGADPAAGGVGAHGEALGADMSTSTAGVRHRR